MHPLQESGEAALEFITDSPALPDIVLLDVTLPGMSGFEVRGPNTHVARSDLKAAVTDLGPGTWWAVAEACSAEVAGN